MRRAELSTKDSRTDNGVAKVLAVAEDQPWQNPSLVYRDPQEEASLSQQWVRTSPAHFKSPTYQHEGKYTYLPMMSCVPLLT